MEPADLMVTWRPGDLWRPDGKGMENPLKQEWHLKEININIQKSTLAGNLRIFPFRPSEKGENADLLAILRGVEVGRSSSLCQIPWDPMGMDSAGTLVRYI